MAKCINPTLGPTVHKRFLQHLPDRPTDGCWYWNGRDAGCYGNIWTGEPGNIRQMMPHRVSWMIHYGDIPDGLCVCHHCDHKACVRPDHLYLASRGQNVRDAAAKGLLNGRNNGGGKKKGEENRRARLNRTQVREIRARYAAGGVTLKELAAEYDVHDRHVQSIIKRRYWAWLTDDD
jgi:hypothetical protein